MNEQEKEIQQLMEKIQKLQESQRGTPQQTHQNFNPEGQFDNQGGEYAQTEGNGMFDNQGPQERPYHSTPPGPKPGPPAPKPQPAPANVINTSGVQPGPPPQTYNPSNVCEQCGLVHPPLKPGQKCPNVSISKDEKNDTGLDDGIINKYLVDMRNIILTNMSKKGIKDGKKYFQNVIVKLTKVLEESND
jgi:hypothetical protein